MDNALASLSDVTVRLRGSRGLAGARVVDGVALSVAAGETLALVGESGCGKSTTALALLGLLPPVLALSPGSTMDFRLKNGSVENLAGLNERGWQGVRGREIAMIFQDPMSALNPVQRVGTQLGESMLAGGAARPAEIRRRSLDVISSLGIPNPERCLASYPHQLSGGMRQRVMIGMALSCQPSLLIADEPTTALDVTIQAQIVELLQEQQKRTGMAILFITHNLGLVAQIASRLCVMYAGRVVETGHVRDIFSRPWMPYTRALLRSVPRIADDGSATRLPVIPGNVPGIVTRPGGCSFHPRCDLFLPGSCDTKVPPLARHGARAAACLRLPEVMDGALVA